MKVAKKEVRVRVAGIIFNNDKILLIAHQKNGNVYWLLPGGGVNFGESLDQALKRELQEELGISVEVKNVALVCDSIDPSGERHIVNICFCCDHISGTYTLGKEERLHSYDFFSREELSSIMIYPPINEDLVAIMNNKVNEIYKGKIWLEK